MGGRTADNGRIGKFSSSSNQNVAKAAYSQKPADLSSAQEDPRSEFYGHYRKEAEEYDKEFMKKYEEDLDTTLIFVSSVRSLGPHVFTRVTGWSVLCRHVCFHPRRPVSPPARCG